MTGPIFGKVFGGKPCFPECCKYPTLKMQVYIFATLDILFLFILPLLQARSHPWINGSTPVIVLSINMLATIKCLSWVSHSDFDDGFYPIIVGLAKWIGVPIYFLISVIMGAPFLTDTDKYLSCDVLTSDHATSGHLCPADPSPYNLLLPPTDGRPEMAAKEILLTIFLIGSGFCVVNNFMLARAVQGYTEVIKTLNAEKEKVALEKKVKEDREKKEREVRERKEKENREKRIREELTNGTAVEM